MGQVTHPNILDNFFLRIYPRYLYPGQLCQSLTTINVGIIHKLPDVTPLWKIMDYLYLKKGSVFKFLGLARNLHIEGEVQPLYSVLQMVSPFVDEKKSFGKHLSPGDMITLTPFDRQFIVPAPPATPLVSPPVEN
jgi:hypothetical protein